MPGHVEGDHAEVFRDAAVVQQAAILAGVGTRRVHAKQRNALSGFLNIQTMRFSQQIAAQIAAGNCFVLWAHRLLSRRGAAMTSLK